MSTPEKNPPLPQQVESQQSSPYYQPPIGERVVVGFMGGLLVGILAFGVIYRILSWEVTATGVISGKYSSRDPFFMGLLAAGLSFLAVFFTIWLLSWRGRRNRFRDKVGVAIKGCFLAGFIGFLIGFHTIREDKVSELSDPILLSTIRYFPYAVFDEINSFKALFGGIGTAGSNAAFSGISLYLLYDRREDRPSQESPQSEQKGK